MTPFVLRLIAPALVLLAGCDSFSVFDQFTPSGGKELRLAVQRTTVLQGGATELYPSGGSPPYTYVTLVDDIYTPSEPLGSVSGQTFTAGTAIGRIRLRVTDAAGNQADAVVVVAPPTPTSFSASFIGNDVAMTWVAAGQSAWYSGFEIWRARDGFDFALVVTVDPNLRNYTDTGAPPSTQNPRYRLYAVSGNYRSAPTPDTSPLP